MARRRMLWPEFFSSRPVNNLSIPAMVTFEGLWVYFDDEGRGEDDPGLVKSAAWPRRRSITEAKVAAHLDEIAAEDLVCRYEVGGANLMHCTSWDEHQKPSHPTPSKLPPCPKHEREAFEEFLNDSDAARERFRSRSGGDPE